uniref:AbrB/MazE/SpoVT family DNA-binding domain-containing protein n=1 Tax=Paractinoplanes polyasparticus TaxID=2856853 RepID=UPI001C865E3C|nr:AbrB/MazE/SpoVT family DNA-binding domain-containing protein [Actinoplanes polyasparticus]
MPVLLQSRYVRPAFYSVTVVDGHGRIAATTPLRALGWTPGTVLEFGVDANRLITAFRIEGPPPPGSTAPRREVTPRGHLNLPAAIRRRADISTGDRLLTAADTNAGILRLLPPKVLALILHAYTADQDQPP